MERHNTIFNIEVAKLLVFNREVEKVGNIMVYRLYLKIKMRKTIVEEQIQ